MITKISEQKRRPNRKNIFLDGKFAFGLKDNVVAKFRLREGIAVDAGQVQAILDGAVRQECFDDAMKCLERRLHSRDELKRKLARKEHPAATVEAVLGDLERLGYVNDRKFATAKAQASAQYKHHGRRRAAVELMKSGVKGEDARRALEDVYEAHDSMAVARQLASKKAASLKRLDPQTARRRLYGMLLRRGFSYEEIRPVVDEVLGDESQRDSESI